MRNEMGNNASGLKEEYNSTTVEPLQGAVQADDVKGQSVVPAAENVDSVRNETGSVFGDTGGVGCSNNHNPKTYGKEEHKTNLEDHQEFLNEYADMEDVNTVNHVAATAEDKDSHGKEPGFEGGLKETADMNVGNQKQDEKADSGVHINGEVELDSAEQTLEMREQEVTESNSVEEHPRTEEKADGVFEMESAPSCKGLEDDENALKSNMQQNKPETTDNHQFEKQSPVDEEDEGNRNSKSDAKSTLNNKETHDATILKHDHFDEVTTISSAGYVKCGNEQQKTEDIEGFLEAYTNGGNGHLDNLDENGSYCTSERVGEEKDEGLDKQLKSQENVDSIQKNEHIEVAEFGAHLGSVTKVTLELRIGCDGKLSTEMNNIKPQLEVSLTNDYLNYPSEDSKPEDKCFALSEETMLTGKESENRENKHHLFETHSDDWLVNRSECMKHLEEMKPIEDNVPPSKNIFQDSRFDEELACSQNEASEEHQHMVKLSLPDAGIISIALSLGDHGCNEGETKQENKTEETCKESETSFAKENISTLDPPEQARAFALEALLKSHEQDNQTKSDKPNNSNDESRPELEQENSSLFLATQASSILSQYNKTFPENQVEVAENNSSINQSSEKYAICETVGRLSSESNPDNQNIHAEMRKSPSFNLDLQIDAKIEESDQTPLLYQDKVEDYLAVPVEEKVVPLETSDSDKARNPIIGLSKEEEKALVPDCPKEQENHSSGKKASPKQVKSNSVKGKQKRRPRSSFLGTCICCATVINEIP